MKTLSVLALMLTMLPMTAYAGAKTSVMHTQKAAGTLYECPICHHEVNAAQAKKLHYICPKDHGKLVPVKTASLHKTH